VLGALTELMFDADREPNIGFIDVTKFKDEYLIRSGPLALEQSESGQPWPGARC
jgi:hypothetical protein